MSASEARYTLQRSLRKYLLLRVTETILFSSAIALTTYGLLKLVTIPYAPVIAITFASIAFLIRSLQINIYKLDENDLVQYINRTYPEMEESTDLLLKKDEELTFLQQLQKLRNINAFESIQQSIKFPNNLIQASALFMLAVLIVAGVSIFQTNGETTRATSKTFTEQPGMEKKLPASVEKVEISVTPPAYTGLPETRIDRFDLKIPQASSVAWSIYFSNEVNDPKLIFSGRDSLALTASNAKFSAQRSFSQSDFYQVSWTNPDGTRKFSDYYQVEVIKDQSPAVIVDNLEQFVALTMTDNLKVELRSTLSDDYGLKDAYVIATVSKGSGESVKFREEKLRFTTPSSIHGTMTHGSLKLDLIKLGLDPGDELYFYIEALDNRAPTPNKARTETFFISLQDTAAVATSVDPGLGVDLMPEYFRSQRQIIIDSEKLLKDRKKITKEAFNVRSNDLAHDQKVLRLRYGEFLGEEFESGIGPQADIIQDDATHESEDDIMKKYGHAHDTENEHNLVEDKKSSRGEGHDHHASGTKTEDPSKAFLHDHDNAEEETFFTQSIRSKLKAAITIMWDAELHLRLYDPGKSLPFQYKALKLLKEISQDSRIYVHRTGFDPPPLKEEKRLKGDLSEIKNSTATQAADASPHYPAIRKALVCIDGLLPDETITVTPAMQTILLHAGQELSSVALSQPGRYLKSLSLLKSLTQQELKPEQQRDALIQIRTAFYNVLPKEVPSPQSRPNTSHGLDERFLDNLNSLN